MLEVKPILKGVDETLAELASLPGVFFSATRSALSSVGYEGQQTIKYTDTSPRLHPWTNILRKTRDREGRQRMVKNSKKKWVLKTENMGYYGMFAGKKLYRQRQYKERKAVLNPMLGQLGDTQQIAMARIMNAIRYEVDGQKGIVRIGVIDRNQKLRALFFQQMQERRTPMTRKKQQMLFAMRIPVSKGLRETVSPMRDPINKGWENFATKVNGLFAAKFYQALGRRFDK